MLRRLCKFGSLLILILAFNLTDHIQARNPTGEKANYNLVKSTNRTSSMIRSGTFSLFVKQFLPHAGELGRGAYSTEFSYDLDIRWRGREKGKEDHLVDKDFFSPEFMLKLQKEGTLVLKSFKVRYLGKRNVQTENGEYYEGCDRIMLYDIDMRRRGIASSMLGPLSLITPMADIRDAKIYVNTYPGIPALGGVTVDMTGTVSGFDVKAGFDYTGTLN